MLGTDSGRPFGGFLLRRRSTNGANAYPRREGAEVLPAACRRGKPRRGSRFEIWSFGFFAKIEVGAPSATSCKLMGVSDRSSLPGFGVQPDWQSGLSGCQNRNDGRSDCCQPNRLAVAPAPRDEALQIGIDDRFPIPEEPLTFWDRAACARLNQIW